MAQQLAQATAQILMDTNCIIFSPDQPFTLTSGKKSPVYVDCRRLIAFPQARMRIIEMGYDLLQTAMAEEKPFDCIAGGETAGIAYAAWMADKFVLPMAYIRKKPKNFGKNARIEGDMYEGQNVLLVEDLFTDGGSKMSFLDAIAEIGAKCQHCFTLFRYGIFPKAEEKFQACGVTLHALACWADIIVEARRSEILHENKICDIESFLENPDEWN